MADAVWTLIETEAKYVTYRAASKDAKHVLDSELEAQYARIGYATLLSLGTALLIAAAIAITGHVQIVVILFVPLSWLLATLVYGEALLAQRRRSGFERIDYDKWTGSGR